MTTAQDIIQRAWTDPSTGGLHRLAATLLTALMSPVIFAVFVGAVLVAVIQYLSRAK